MRLINVNTLELEEFLDDNIPRYAILSHTWGQEEVSFQDLCWLHDYEKNRMTYASVEALIPQIGQNMENKATAIRQRAGFDKIVQSARLAKERELQYVWVDTCCIDKTSSAELSEAINSMFRWYERSDICLAFLSDVSRDRGHGRSNFRSSRWFTRGWTLQELLAPRFVQFYERHWKPLLDRKVFSGLIESFTGIPRMALERRFPLDHWSLAERISWASKRKTSRKEDMAYCLMGLFEVSMPLLYGEGDKAFVRLQKEIVKEHRGQSLFAWGYNESAIEDGSLFAHSPAVMGSAEIFEEGLSSAGLFHLNNRGLEISLDVFQVPIAGLSRFYYALWDVSFSREEDRRYMTTHRLCFPLFPSFEKDEKNKDGGQLEDGRHMAKCQSGPLVISEKHIPVEKRRQRMLIMKDDVFSSVVDKDRCKLATIHIDSLHQLLPSARLVEIFPPPVKVSKRGVKQDIWFFGDVVSEAYLLRLLVLSNDGEKIMRGNMSVQLVVVFYSQGFTIETAAVEWMDGSRVTKREARQRMRRVEATEETGEKDRETAAFCSLADAAFAGIPLLEAQTWTNVSAPFLVDGKPLQVKVDTHKSGFNFHTQTKHEILNVRFSSI